MGGSYISRTYPQVIFFPVSPDHEPQELILKALQSILLNRNQPQPPVGELKTNLSSER